MNNKSEVFCSYCGEVAELVKGDVIYPHREDLAHLKFWQCAPCDAYVGTHKNSKDHKPLGRLADRELRMWKQNAHALFDPIWKSAEMGRRAAYTWLSDQMQLPYYKTHIGMFDVDQCKQVVDICKTKRQSYKELRKKMDEVTAYAKNNSDTTLLDILEAT